MYKNVNEDDGDVYTGNPYIEWDIDEPEEGGDPDEGYSDD
jgi:hypothetical protein